MEKRQWQLDCSQEVSKALKKKKSIVSIASCVGSGKTYAAWDAMAQWIKMNKKKKTLQIFVCPRISLCSQQAIDAYTYLNSECGNVEVLLVNSNQSEVRIEEGGQVIKSMKDFSTTPDASKSNHFVLVFCDASLWGDAENSDKPDSHYSKVVNFLEMAKEEGFQLGVIAYDEAHNYRNRQVEMFGREYNA